MWTNANSDAQKSVWCLLLKSNDWTNWMGERNERLTNESEICVYPRELLGSNLRHFRLRDISLPH